MLMCDYIHIYRWTPVSASVTWHWTAPGQLWQAWRSGLQERGMPWMDSGKRYARSLPLTHSVYYSDCTESRMMCLKVVNGVVNQSIVDEMGCLPLSAVKGFSLACCQLDSTGPERVGGWLQTRIAPNRFVLFGMCHHTIGATSWASSVV